MTIDLIESRVFYNSELGQLIVTKGDFALGVFLRTTDPYKTGIELLEKKAAAAGNIASCLLVQPPLEDPPAAILPPCSDEPGTDVTHLKS